MRVVRGGGVVLGSIVLFVVAAVAGALLHLNTPRARHVAAAEVNDVLSSSFQGRIAIRRIGSIGIFGFTNTDATVDDASGHRVLSIRGARVRIATLAAARSALFETKAPLTIDLTGVAIDSIDVRLDTDAHGNLELLNAFASSTPSNPNGRGMRLVIRRATLGHAWAHGTMSGAPPLDVDLDDFRGALTYAPDLLEADVSNAQITARRIARGADVVGFLQARVRKPTDATQHPDARVAWDGRVGVIAQSIRGSFVNDTIDAVVDVPESRPGSIRSVWAESTIDRPAQLHLEAHGKLAGVGVDLHAGVGEAAFDATGHLVLQGEKTAKVTVHARDIDAHELTASAPRSRLGLTGEVLADMKADGALSGDVALRFLGGALGSKALPSASIHATLSQSATKRLSANAEIVVDEPGAPTKVILALAPKGGSSVLDFKVSSNVADFQKVPELGHAVHGSFQMSAAGHADVTKKTIDAQLHAAAAGVAAGATRVQSASVETRVRGAFDAPEIDATVRSRGIVAGGLRFVSADVTAKGTSTASSHVTASVRGPDTPDIDAGVDLGLKGGLSLADLRVVLARAGERSVVTAREVKIGGGHSSVDDARIEGLGAPLTATLSTTPTTARVRASTRGIDLARVARLVHIEKLLQGGTITLDTDLDVRHGAGKGRLTLDAVHVVAGKARDVSAHVDLSLAGRTAVAKAHGDIPGVAMFDVNAPKVSFGGRRGLAAGAWKEAFGSVDIDARADLAKLVALAPAEDMPLSEAHGRVVLKAHLARDSVDDVTPAVKLEATTDQLVLAPPVSTERDIDGVLVHTLPAWRLAGIDFVIAGDIDGETGHLRMSTKAHDAKGALAQLDAALDHIPYADLLRDSGRLATDLRTTDLDVHLVVPERGLGGLPPPFEQKQVRGSAAANVTVKGKILAPTVNVAATLRHASFAGSVTEAPFDVDIAAHYDGEHGTGSVKARSHDQEVLDFETKVDGALEKMLEAKGATPAWSASARAHMASFPLQSIGALDDKLVSGNLSGDFSLTGLHEDAHVDAKASIDALSVGSVGYKSANLVLKADGHVVDASIRVDQTDGFGETKAHAAASWGAAMAPTLDPSQPLDATFSAKNFRVAALLPFLGGVLDELDGRVDANTNIVLDPSSKGAKLNGTLTLTRGTVEAPAGGGELHDVTANLKFAPDGTITLEKLSAAGLSGKLDATGTAQLEGMALRSAQAVITIPSKSALPVTAAGSPVGDVDGRIEIKASTPPGDHAMQVSIEVPKMNVKLPEESTGNPQSLGAMPDNVRIGAHRGDPARFVILPLDPVKKKEDEERAQASGSGSSVTLTTHLADVHVVRGAQLKVDLDGNVKVSSGAASSVTGQIHLKKGGTLDVQGRKFTIENGTITFVDDDASNPQVVVKASWTAPDRTIVYATFTGPLKTGKVALTSQPQMTREEIVQLLLYGSADGKQAQSPSSSTETSAIAAAGSEATQPLNHMLNRIGLGAVTTKIDTSESANPKSEVEVQVARDISVEVAVVLGQPPPGVNPDTTLLVLDWRFLSKWSLSTTVGNAGTTIFDLLWQRRYY